MTRTITQETFDNAVHENVELFDMNIEDAIQETVQQFEKQGVSLDNIIKDLQLSDTSKKYDTLLEKISELKTLSQDPININDDECIIILDFITEECKKDIAYRLVCGKEQLYPALLRLLNKCKITRTVITLKTLIAMMTGYPDLLDETGINLMMELLHQTDDEVRRYTLKWIAICCVKHERNRQNIFDKGVLNHLKSMIQNTKLNNDFLIKEMCAVCRALVLDDDVRVEFGHAHEHAKAIASDILCPLMKLLEAHKKNESIVGDLLITLSSLLVRTEYCKQVQDTGGIEFICEAMLTFVDKDNIIRKGLIVLKTLAGNDDCKYAIISKGAAPIIAASMEKHKKNENLIGVGLACIAALTLRAPENSEEFYRIGIPDLIVECLKLHPDNVAVQKHGSWAIRNMVSRNKEQCKYFISIGAEQELNKALLKFANKCEYDIKSALRDLGCNVQLREEWTGKGGKLQTDEGQHRDFNDA